MYGSCVTTSCYTPVIASGHVMGRLCLPPNGSGLITLQAQIYSACFMHTAYVSSTSHSGEPSRPEHCAYRRSMSISDRKSLVWGWPRGCFQQVAASAVDKMGFIVGRAGPFHGQNDLQPFVGQSWSSIVIPRVLPWRGFA